MMENPVLQQVAEWIVQSITGCRSWAVKDGDHGEKVHLVKEVLTVVYPMMSRWLPSLFGATALRSGECELRILKDSGRGVVFPKATAYGLLLNWKAGQHVITKAFKHPVFQWLLWWRGQGNRELCSNRISNLLNDEKCRSCENSA